MITDVEEVERGKVSQGLFWDEVGKTQQVLETYGDDEQKVIAAAVEEEQLMEYKFGSETALYIAMAALYQTAAMNGWGYVQDNPEAFGLVANPNA